MRTDRSYGAFYDLCLLLMVPGLSLTVLLASPPIFINAQETHRSLDAGIILLALAISTIILLWWISGALGIIYSVARAKDKTNIVFPPWAPAILKRITIALLGLSLFTSPAHASGSAPASAVSYSASVSISPLFGDTSPVSNESEGVPLRSSDITTLDPVHAEHAERQNNSGSVVLPLFLGAPREAETIPKAQSTNQHIVLPGESLWSIAQQRLGSQATDIEILALTEQIYSLNAPYIGIIQDSIFAGQVLEIPTL